MRNSIPRDPAMSTDEICPKCGGPLHPSVTRSGVSEHPQTGARTQITIPFLKCDRCDLEWVFEIKELPLGRG